MFYDRLDHALVRARRTRRPMAVLFMDIDHFKAVNDRHGHSGGDALLRKFSERLRRSVRKADTVARLAGDEFTIILEELHDRADVEKVADTIMRTIKMPLKLGELDVNITASMGIAIYTGENIGSAELLDRADLALYAVKRQGRDAFLIYSRDIDNRGSRETAPEIVCLSGTWKRSTDPWAGCSSAEKARVDALKGMQLSCADDPRTHTHTPVPGSGFRGRHPAATCTAVAPPLVARAARAALLRAYSRAAARVPEAALTWPASAFRSPCSRASWVRARPPSSTASFPRSTAAASR